MEEFATAESTIQDVKLHKHTSQHLRHKQEGRHGDGVQDMVQLFLVTHFEVSQPEL